MAGFGALRQLDFDHLDLRRLGLLRKTLGVKVAVRRATSKVTRGDLPDQVAAMFAVVARNTAFARVVGKAAQGSTSVQGFHGVGRQCPKAHARNVEQRQVIGLRALSFAHSHPECGRVGLYRLQRMGYPLGAWAVHVFDAAKTAFVVFDFGSGVNHGPLVARKRKLFLIVFQKVLPQLGPNVFQSVTQATCQGVVAADGLFGLLEVHPSQNKQDAEECAGPR